MTSPLRRTAAIALVLPALALAACGSDDKDSTTAATTATPAAPAPLAQAALASKANAICKTANDKAKTVDLPQASDGAAAVAAYFDPLTAPPTAQQPDPPDHDRSTNPTEDPCPPTLQIPDNSPATPTSSGPAPRT